MKSSAEANRYIIFLPSIHITYLSFLSFAKIYSTSNSILKILINSLLFLKTFFQLLFTRFPEINECTKLAQQPESLEHSLYYQILRFQFAIKTDTNNKEHDDDDNHESK